LGPSCLLFKRGGQTDAPALYRKYRPKTFDDVVGQQHITTILKNEIATGRIAHAICSPVPGGQARQAAPASWPRPSTAKTLSPEILLYMRSLPLCRRGNADVSFGDRRRYQHGVDNIRELREGSGFSPGMARYRVYIIDEVHMLSTSAFNALLKIMEDRPSI
jgi:DNA polymerase-3 subunit gamma/tau